MSRLTKWEIDRSHSSVGFAVTHMMFTTVRGRFTRLTGTIVVDEEHPDQSSVEVEIDAASIDTGLPDRDQHLRSAEFLDVDNHPTIVFQSRQIEGVHAKAGDHFRVGGSLTIRGRTVPVTLNATFSGVGKDPWGHQRAGFAASTEIDRRDWGLEWNQALETGGLLVAYTVAVQVDVEAVQHEGTRAAVA